MEFNEMDIFIVAIVYRLSLFVRYGVVKLAIDNSKLCKNADIQTQLLTTITEKYGHQKARFKNVLNSQ